MATCVVHRGPAVSPALSEESTVTGDKLPVRAQSAYLPNVLETLVQIITEKDMYVLTSLLMDVALKTASDLAPIMCSIIVH